MSAQEAVSAPAHGIRGKRETRPDHPSQVTIGVCPNDLDGDVPTGVVPLPHVGKPTPVQRAAIPIIRHGDMDGTREKCVMATQLIQHLEVFF